MPQSANYTRFPVWETNGSLQMHVLMQTVITGWHKQGTVALCPSLLLLIILRYVNHLIKPKSMVHRPPNLCFLAEHINQQLKGYSKVLQLAPKKAGILKGASSTSRPCDLGQAGSTVFCTTTMKRNHSLSLLCCCLRILCYFSLHGSWKWNKCSLGFQGILNKPFYKTALLTDCFKNKKNVLVHRQNIEYIQFQTIRGKSANTWQ